MLNFKLTLKTSWEVIGCPPGDRLLIKTPGKPFRLSLWHKVARFLDDPDAAFFLNFLLVSPKGVNESWSLHPRGQHMTA
jgi:hypothetical protein